MRYKIFINIMVIVILAASIASAEERGGIVLSFDDGYPSWINIIAPELARVGGMATGFVNNQRIHFGDLSFEDLRTLQNKYGWEIGTHTYHHFNAQTFMQQKGMSAWVKEELDASISELQSQGLKIQSIVFPYNAFTKELSAEVMKRLKSFRRDEVFPIVDDIDRDGSVAGTEFDIGFYVPIEQVFRWIDFAQQQNKFLFLYSHKVLPDEEFVTGIVTSVSTRALVTKDKSDTTSKVDLCLVPDLRRRVYRALKVESINGDIVNILQGNLSSLSEPGATFMIGPCYGMQLSYFRRIIEYSAERLPFYTVNEAVSKIQRSKP